ncbi:unnamed protein product [Dimorphilus gyrociliatus]|uniref:G-protein coupled receptors family 1 profile domain-containing protein n=1 Tax=Dimorphilus gyrociliatus TaxID=2664684 RepID=A0A7I8VBH9_9ANNE|nr:unnamed protein product [Dimorphilus gyrociliatus]
MSKRRALAGIGIVWTASSAISFVPIYLGWFASEDFELYVDNPECGLDVNRPYAVISSFTSFYAPLLVMVVVYSKIFRIAREQAREIAKLERFGNGDRLRKKSKKISRDAKAIKTLGTLMGLFCISWLPFFIMYVVMPFCKNCPMPDEVEMFITWLGYANSLINPCVYAFLNRDFRYAFATILRCKRFCDRRSDVGLVLEHRHVRLPTSDCAAELMEENRREMSS